MGKRFYISGGLMVGIITLVFVWKTMSKALHPLLYFFLYSIPSNTAISLFPHEPVLVFLGAGNDPVMLAIVASLGTIVAGVLDYYVFVPLFAHTALDDLHGTKGYQTAIKWFSYQPFVTIIIAGFTPVPFFIFKFVAFAARYPLPRYLAAVLIGRFPRYYLLALIGKVFDLPNWFVLGLFVAMLSLYIIQGIPQFRKIYRQRKMKAAGESNPE